MRPASRIALITGAAQGIGAAIAVRLVSEGAAVACVDRDGETLERTVAGLSRTGGAPSRWSPWPT